jgi:hypothetical protein
MSHDADDSNSSTPGLDDLIPLREAAKLGGLSPSHLRLLVCRGDVWGLELARNWVTTAQAVEAYPSGGHYPRLKLIVSFCQFSPGVRGADA